MSCLAEKCLLQNTENGLYCPPGDFYIDPWLPVPRAVITHAHSDHARPGSEAYLTAEPGAAVLRRRLGEDARIETLPYAENKDLGGARVSLHPAGHILGSAQVRIEVAGQVAVITGDYKTDSADTTCTPFEPLRCHLLVSECTFGLPIYRWPMQSEILSQIHAWWQASQEQQRTAILQAYSLGKAQRILAALDLSLGPVLVHGAVEAILPAYRAAGIELPDVPRANDTNARATRGRALVLAPPGATASLWVRKFGPVSTAIASGWMQLRGTRRRKAVDRGFALSDHADWQALNDTIAATGAEEVWLTHGSTGPMTRWLVERGVNARAITTRFEGELDEQSEQAEPSDADELRGESNGAGSVPTMSEAD
jgi:putative mRNA 3-end processing factor